MTDPYGWLEDLDGAAAMTWVRERNAAAFASLTGGTRFAGLRDGIRAVLDSAQRIPVPYWHGELLYNFWQDREHPRGLWRRTTLDEYRRPGPDWQILLDVDALAAAEGEKWVFQDVDHLRPGGVDEERVRPHETEQPPVDQPLRLGRMGQVQRDHVGLGE